MSLVNCLQKAGDFLSPDDKAELLAAASRYRKNGMSASEAAMRAVDEQIAKVDKLIESPPAEVKPEGPAAEAEGASAEPRMDAIRAQFPDLMVQLDGMDKPMRLDDFMAAVKAEADEMAADAPLMQVAAECALLHAG